jgi:hypothetical protein
MKTLVQEKTGAGDGGKFARSDKFTRSDTGKFDSIARKRVSLQADDSPLPRTPSATILAAHQAAHRIPRHPLPYKQEKENEACPMESPVLGHTGYASDRLKHVTERIHPLLNRGPTASSQYAASQFRVFGSNATVAFTAVQLCEIFMGTDNQALRAAALWGLGALVCEVTDLQNFIGNGSIILSRIIADASGQGGASPSLQSCAAFAIACLVRFNNRLQDRAISEPGLVQHVASVLQNSTNPGVIFSYLQAVGNLCYNNVRVQRFFAEAGVLSIVDALSHAKDTRIHKTASRCRETFLQLLARGPELRAVLSSSHCMPFDKSPKQTSPSRPANPGAVLLPVSQESRPSARPTTACLQQSEVINGFIRRRPATAINRTINTSMLVPTKPTSPRKQPSTLQQVLTGSYSMYQPRGFTSNSVQTESPGSKLGPSLNVRRIPVSGSASVTRPISDNDHAWTTRKGASDDATPCISPLDTLNRSLPLNRSKISDFGLPVAEGLRRKPTDSFMRQPREGSRRSC